jgi:hypothetical protein
MCDVSPYSQSDFNYAIQLKLLNLSVVHSLILPIDEVDFFN